MPVREFTMSVVTRSLMENVQITGNSESLYVMLVDHVIGDKVELHKSLRVTLRDTACEQGYEGEMGFVWFKANDINGPWLFSIPLLPDWIEFFETELDPNQFANVVGTVSVDMDRLAAAV